MSRLPRRAAVVVGAAGVIVALLTASASPALASDNAGAATPASPAASATSTTTWAPAAANPVAATTTTTSTSTTTTTTTTVPRTTTTTAPRPKATTPPRRIPPTTKARPRTTTTTRPTTTTTKPKPKAKGVPKVPVGVPPLPPTAPGSPPPNPTVILRQVQADLAQLAAIQDYSQARAAVANSQQSVALAAATLQTAEAGRDQAQAAQQAAQNHLDVATARVQDLAVAAYMGLGFLTPAAGPLQVQESQTGTVSTPGGLTGSAAMDTTEMLRVVAQHERQDFRDSRVAVRDAGRAIRAAVQQVADARSSVAAAQSALAASNQTLELVIKAAKTPGLAASLNLPSLPGLAGISGDPSPLTGSTLPAGGTASGLAALAAPAAASTPSTSTPSTSTPVPAATSPTTSPTTGAAANPGGGTGSSAQATSPASPTILGPSVLTGAEMAGWFASTRRHAHTTVPMAQLANDYALAGQQTHVRADLAFAQSIIETAFFSFPAGGQLTPKDNNFAGIGACDSCAHGWSFADALTGVTAQMQLLDAYASPVAVPTNLVGNVGVGGCCPTWMELAGTWASNLEYGIEILTIYHQMLGWVIPQRLVAAGLLAAPKPPPAPAPATAQGAGGAKSGASSGSSAASLPAQPALAQQAVRPAK